MNQAGRVAPPPIPRRWHARAASILTAARNSRILWRSDRHPVGQGCGAMMWRWVAFVVAVLWCAQALAVPFGYRYVGSRVVSEGRHVYWYWNVDAVEIGPYGNSFVARMYARNVELGEERSYAAIIRCDTRTYRRFDSKEPFEAIDEGDPVFAVWRAGCADGRAVQRDARFERLNGSSAKAGTESGGESVARAGSEPA